MRRLKQGFFNRATVDVAQELLGKILTFGPYQGRITETEAYCGFDDPASHAARGETPRNAVMFGKPAVSYVYLIYGMYHCFNIVTEPKGYPAAVLIRGVQTKDTLLNGPGKLCRAFGITREHNGLAMTQAPFGVFDDGVHYAFETTSRIGIKQGIEKPWRFVVKKSMLVSG